MNFEIHLRTRHRDGYKIHEQAWQEIFGDPSWTAEDAKKAWAVAMEKYPTATIHGTFPVAFDDPRLKNVERIEPETLENYQPEGEKPKKRGRPKKETFDADDLEMAAPVGRESTDGEEL